MTNLDLLWVALRLGVGVWLLARVGRPSAVAATGPRSSCSVVIPARNEARVLPGLIDSLTPQLLAGDELLVVDDDSDDDTADLAAGRGARVLAAPPLAPAWTGKNAACWAGA